MFEGLFNRGGSNDEGALLGDAGDDKVPHLAELLLGGEPLEDIVQNYNVTKFKGISLVKNVVIDDLDAIGKLVRIYDLLGQCGESRA